MKLLQTNPLGHEYPEAPDPVERRYSLRRWPL